MASVTQSHPATERAIQRLDRYERIRAAQGLPQLDSVLLKDRVEITWPDLPAPVAVDRLDGPFSERALRWLVKVEEAWGEPLGAHLTREDLRFDPQRRQFALGPSLFAETGDPALMRHLGSRLGVSPEVMELLRSFKELALRAGLEDLGLDEATQIRMLLAGGRQALQQARFQAAARDAKQAWELRPGDEDAGTLLLEAARREQTLLDDSAIRAIAQTLSQTTNASAVLLLALSRYYFACSDPHTALRIARAAVERDPASPKAWRSVARAAQKVGDAAQVTHGLTRAAALGDLACLQKLTRVAPGHVWRPIVRDWTGTIDAFVLGLQLQDHVQEHRFRRALQEALHRPQLLGQLDDRALRSLERAASASRGGSLRLRESLRPFANAGDNHALQTSYARLCLADGQPDELLRLSDLHPGRLDPEVLLRAHIDLGDWQTVLELTTVRPELARIRLLALQRLATGSGQLPEPTVLLLCLKDLEEAGGLDAARELLEQLGTTLADHPFTAMLVSVLDRLEASE